MSTPAPEPNDGRDFKEGRFTEKDPLLLLAFLPTRLAGGLPLRGLVDILKL